MKMFWSCNLDEMGGCKTQPMFQKDDEIYQYPAALAWSGGMYGMGAIRVFSVRTVD